MLGHKVCQLLQDHQVTGLVRRSAAEYEIYPEIFRDASMLGGINVLDESLDETVRRIEPRFIVNCVGVVKQLEEAGDPFLSVAINSLLPHSLARLCQEIGARLIHISTDCVFDGTRGSYSETDLSDARDFYGRSKALGETLPSETSAVTLRTSFIGREIKTRTHGLLEWFLARNGGSVDGFANVTYTGLTSLELAGVIQLIVDRDMDLSGVFQVASEPISKYALLMLIQDVFGLDIDVRRTDVPVSDRSLIMGPFTEATGYSSASWAAMVQEMFEDPTPYDRWKQQEGRS